MSRALTEFSGYIFTLVMAFYIAGVFLALKKRDEDRGRALFAFLQVLCAVFYVLALAILLNLRKGTDSFGLTYGLGGAEFLTLMAFPILFRKLYRDTDELLLCQMQMLLAMGFIALLRLRPDHALRQFYIIAASLVLFFFVPIFLKKLKFIKNIWFVFAGAGCAALLIVLLTGRMVNGSRLAFTLFGFSIQSSEAVKLIFPLCIAGMLKKHRDLRTIIFSAAVGAAHVLILVFSKDLGSALVLFIMYAAMLHVATGKQRYLLAGLGAGAVSAAAAFILFSHVRQRVLTWLDPWADMDNKGYQLTQSLMGIATGGWMGMGLGGGAPKSIPYVEEDFVFSALAEEFGALFGILLILLCLSVVLRVLLLAARIKDGFYRIAASGLAVCYGAQVILTIGGGTGFIPLTGVTLPLISNGGSSAMCTIVLFGMLQGMYMLRMEEFDEEAERAEAAEEKEDGEELNEFPEEDEEQRRENAASGRCIFVNSLIYTLVYLAMCINIISFMHSKAPEVVTNPYNARRTNLLLSRNTRGSIFASDGSILAYSDGDERIYPGGELYAHAVGYAANGGSGVEKTQMRYLISSDVSLSYKLSDISGNRKDPGNNVYTTLVPGLQRAAYEALGDRRGAIIVTKVGTGAVLAMVSAPAFDPAEIEELWSDMIKDEESGVLLNRASQGMYPPGSTFKILTALEYIREYPGEYDSYEFDCSGHFAKDGGSIQCYHETAHGKEDLTASFANSCNTSFANIGLRLDAKSFGKTLDDCGMNRAIDTDIESGRCRVSVSQDMSANDMMQLSIGQSDTQMSPLMLNMITAAVAEDGIMRTPYITDRVVNAEGRVLLYHKTDSGERIMSEEEAEVLTGLMQAVVEGGTAKRIAGQGYTAAGKTGSAEFCADKNKSHAWFTGFAPVEKPEIAVTVILEDSGSGGEAAAPAAGKLFKVYFGLE
ncbi:MAG: FtsW/RodA/SpoVE family cell cycle protein [Lachnospiraceae bacterium]|nr:FtsW/RodA/SpoVE family cell cycle protein [Lachnospiraceae bacterium]